MRHTAGLSDFDRGQLARELEKARIEGVHGLPAESAAAIIEKLNAIVVKAQEGGYDHELPSHVSTYLRFFEARSQMARVYSALDDDTKACFTRVLGPSFDAVMQYRPGGPIERKPGAPVTQSKRSFVAEDVAFTLLASGVRSRRRLRGALSVLPRSADGWFAGVLSIVLPAAGFSIPTDLREIASEIAPHAERRAFLE